jgi:hypothetical protein
MLLQADSSMMSAALYVPSGDQGDMSVWSPT